MFGCINTPPSDPRFAVADPGPDFRNDRYEDPGRAGAIRGASEADAPGPVFVSSARDMGRSAYYDHLMRAQQGMTGTDYRRVGRYQATAGLGGLQSPLVRLGLRGW